MGRISVYSQCSAVALFWTASTRQRRSSVCLTRGSQWSENGRETARRPVNQLLTRQNTRPLTRSFPALDVVKTHGVYPYVCCKASSQPLLWNTDAAACESRNWGHRGSVSGSISSAILHNQDFNGLEKDLAITSLWHCRCR